MVFGEAVSVVTERVTCTVDGGVADVRLNRPEKRNALDPEMFAALADTGEALKSDRSVRAVVLSGEGPSFCAGLDFSTFESMAGGSPREGTRSITETDGRMTHLGQQAVWVWHELPVPTIAAVRGHALGGGCQIAVGCDLRLVAADAQFSVLEIRWGLSPDMTITQLLPSLVGLDVAKELTFTGRIVPGEEAVRIGLATRLCADPHAEAMALAREIASKSPDAIRGAKALFNQSGRVGVAEQLAAERTTIQSLIGSYNQVEAVKAFFEKRPASYRDPS